MILYIATVFIQRICFYFVVYISLRCTLQHRILEMTLAKTHIAMYKKTNSYLDCIVMLLFNSLHFLQYVLSSGKDGSALLWEITSGVVIYSVVLSYYYWYTHHHPTFLSRTL